MKSTGGIGNLGAQKYEAQRNMIRMHNAKYHAEPTQETSNWRKGHRKLYKVVDGRKILKEKEQKIENVENRRRLKRIKEENRKGLTKEYAPGWRIGQVNGGMCIDCYRTDNPIVEVYDKLHSRRIDREREAKRCARVDAVMKLNMSRVKSDLAPSVHAEFYRKNRYKSRFFFNKQHTHTSLHLGLVKEAKKQAEAERLKKMQNSPSKHTQHQHHEVIHPLTNAEKERKEKEAEKLYHYWRGALRDDMLQATFRDQFNTEIYTKLNSDARFMSHSWNSSNRPQSADEKLRRNINVYQESINRSLTGVRQQEEIHDYKEYDNAMYKQELINAHQIKEGVWPSNIQVNTQVTDPYSMKSNRSEGMARRRPMSAHAVLQVRSRPTMSSTTQFNSLNDKSTVQRRKPKELNESVSDPLEYFDPSFLMIQNDGVDKCLDNNDDNEELKEYGNDLDKSCIFQDTSYPNMMKMSMNNDEYNDDDLILDDDIITSPVLSPLKMSRKYQPPTFPANIPVVTGTRTGILHSEGQGREEEEEEEEEEEALHYSWRNLSIDSPADGYPSQPFQRHSSGHQNQLRNHIHRRFEEVGVSMSKDTRDKYLKNEQQMLDEMLVVRMAQKWGDGSNKKRMVQTFDHTKDSGGGGGGGTSDINVDTDEKDRDAMLVSDRNSNIDLGSHDTDDPSITWSLPTLPFVKDKDTDSLVSSTVRHDHNRTQHHPDAEAIPQARVHHLPRKICLLQTTIPCNNSDVIVNVTINDVGYTIINHTSNTFKSSLNKPNVISTSKGLLLEAVIEQNSKDNGNVSDTNSSVYLNIPDLKVLCLANQDRHGLTVYQALEALQSIKGDFMDDQEKQQLYTSVGESVSSTVEYYMCDILVSLLEVHLMEDRTLSIRLKK